MSITGRVRIRIMIENLDRRNYFEGFAVVGI
jgi:hypothetical protein